MISESYNKIRICWCVSTGGKGVKIDIGNISNMDAGCNVGDIGAGNNCNVMGEFCLTLMGSLEEMGKFMISWLKTAVR